MPREGYRTITVTEETYQQLEKAAEEENRSIPNLIEVLVTGRRKRGAS
jgi:predicted CopG family antitoxin